jgi:GntR family transcriptional regulator
MRCDDYGAFELAWKSATMLHGSYGRADHDLGELAGVSRITARRALGTLENEGLICRRQGLGSFVVPPKLPQGLVRLTDFAQDMERAGLEPSSGRA